MNLQRTLKRTWRETRISLDHTFLVPTHCRLMPCKQFKGHPHANLRVFQGTFPSGICADFFSYCISLRMTQRKLRFQKYVVFFLWHFSTFTADILKISVFVVVLFPIKLKERNSLCPLFSTALILITFTLMS